MKFNNENIIRTDNDMMYGLRNGAVAKQIKKSFLEELEKSRHYLILRTIPSSDVQGISSVRVLFSRTFSQTHASEPLN